MNVLPRAMGVLRQCRSELWRQESSFLNHGLRRAKPKTPMGNFELETTIFVQERSNYRKAVDGRRRASNVYDLAKTHRIVEL